MIQIAEQTTVGELLTRLREAMDEIDALNAQLSEARARREEVERELLRRAENDGVDSYRNDQITVTVTEKLRAKYDPDQWDNLLSWAVQTGNTHVIQRRLTDARIESLIIDGVEIPGVTLEGYKKINVRRK